MGSRGELVDLLLRTMACGLQQQHTATCHASAFFGCSILCGALCVVMTELLLLAAALAVRCGLGWHHEPCSTSRGVTQQITSHDAADTAL
jgi:hypothetical protein